MTSTPTAAKGPALGGIAALGIAIVGFSLGSTMVKSAHLPGPVTAWWRLALAAVIWLVVVAVRKEMLTKAEWKATVFPGLLFGVNLVCFFTGVTKTRVANAEFIGTLTPVFIVPFAAIRLKERVPRVVMALGALALCGVSLIVLLSGKGGKHSLAGDLFIVGAMTTWSSFLVLARKARSSMGVASFMTGMSVFAAITVLPFAIGTHRLGTMTTHAAELIALSAVVSGVAAHGLLSFVQQRVPISTIVLIQLVQPGLGAMWAWLFLGESIKPIQLLGMALVLIAVGGIARISTIGARIARQADQGSTGSSELEANVAFEPDQVVVDEVGADR